MFSVEDLLVSQGYKPSKNPTNSSEDPHHRDQNEDTGRRSGQASRNGLPTHLGAIPKTNRARRYQNDDKGNLVMRGRQWNAHHEDFSSPASMQGGPYDQSQLSRSSLSKKDKDLAYWKRHCQDFSAHGYRDRLDSEARGMATACALYEDENESQWKIDKELEYWKNKQGTMKSPADYRRQSLKTETQKQPTAFGQPENKSQSCPRFFSPENSNSGEIPAIASSKVHKIKPELESFKHSEPATRPKYGRPLKPPSYEFHQQSRGMVETNPPQEDQQACKTTFCVTKVDESGQDPTLEPPVYIPPPSYKSPSEQSKNQHVSKVVSNYDESFVKEMQLLEQSIYINSESSVNQLQMEEAAQALYSSKTQGKSQETHQSSVQYIPFDDPRIRHIKVIHPADHQMEDKAEDVKNSISYKNYVDQEFNNSHVDVPDSVKCSQVSGSSRWLVESNADQDSCALSTQGGSYDTGNNLICEYTQARQCAQSPGATGVSSERLTKVKTFEPGTEIQSKNHLKKKTNETMFYLVSVPLQSELHMPGSSGELKGSDKDLKDQSFLSTSSTDLELQALTGNMINVLEKQGFQRPAFKQMNDRSCKQPPKHRELGYSGSWLNIRYKDQQTQTSLNDESQIQQPLHGSQLRKSNTLTNGHFLKYGSSTTESAPSTLPTDNRKDKPIIPPRKTQPIKPSKPECPRAVVNPRTGPTKSCTTSTGLSGRKNEPGFAHKEERKSPCSTKEAFGQFLLKPVSRRPWDAISELENFNKEIQKQEERSEDDKKIEQNQEREKMKKEEEEVIRVDKAGQDYGRSAQMRKAKPVTSAFKKETDKSKPEREDTSKLSGARKYSNLRYVKSEAREKDKSVKEKRENIDLKEKDQNARKVIKQAIEIRPIKTNISGCSGNENSSMPFSTINSKEASVENHKNKDSVKQKKAACRNIPALEIVPIAPLSFKRRNQGRSEPNLSSVGLDVNKGTSIPGTSTNKIPPNETLQTRAARILGIEVAVESLTSGNNALRDEDYDSNNMAQINELSKKKMMWAEIKKDVASSKGKPKSGWPKSTFTGENVLGSVKEQLSGKVKLAREPSFRTHPDQHQTYTSNHQKDQACSPQSATLHLAERKLLPSNVEINRRSTSKVTVPKQGKVASAVSRAAMDRLARMKEVDSVSRMRRLGIKNGGEGRDEDPKQVKKPEGKGNDSAVGRTEFPRKLSQGSCVSKRVISLNENDQLGNRNTKKSGRDLRSSEVYDPSRVGRV